MAEASAAQRRYLHRLRRRDRAVTAVRWGILFVLLFIWELAAYFGWIDAFLLSSPSRMMATLWSLLASGELLTHIGVSLAETLLGFALGAGLGFLLAVLMWWSETLCRVLDPYLVILNALPKIALGPVLIVWMGVGMRAIVVMSLLISVVVVLVTVLGGFLEVGQEKLTLLRSFGATRWQCLLRAVVPGSLPTTISALKLGISMSWVGVIVGEFLVSRAGLGYLIVYGGQVFKLDLVMAATALLCALAALMYFAVAALEKTVKRKRGAT